MAFTRLAGSIIAALICVSDAKAQDNIYSGSFIMKACDRNYKENEFPKGFCAGEIRALLSLNRSKVIAEGLRSCPPDSVTLEQGQQVVVKYITDHPARLNEPFLASAIGAMLEAWPCK